MCIPAGRRDISINRRAQPDTSGRGAAGRLARSRTWGLKGMCGSEKGRVRGDAERATWVAHACLNHGVRRLHCVASGEQLQLTGRHPARMTRVWDIGGERG